MLAEHHLSALVGVITGPGGYAIANIGAMVRKGPHGQYLVTYGNGRMVEAYDMPKTALKRFFDIVEESKPQGASAFTELG